MRAGMLRNTQEVSKPSRVGRPRDEGDFGLDALESNLHPPHEIFHASIRPMLISAKRGIVEIRRWNIGPGIVAVIFPAMFAITHASVVQPIEAERIDVRKFCQDFGQHINEEIPIRPKQTQHSSMRKLHHVRLRDLGCIGGNSPPVWMQFVGFCLQARRIDAKDADAESLIFGNISGQAIRRHMRTMAFQ